MSRGRKVVIRQLPADLPETVFWDTLDPSVPVSAAKGWRTYIRGKRSDFGKDHATSRAYIELPDDAAVMEFVRGFDGHTFVDKRGHYTQARVEIAPFQRVPFLAGKRRMDPRQGSIDDDQEYVAFLSSLMRPLEPLNSPHAPAIQANTPLLEYLHRQRMNRANKTIEKGKSKALDRGKRTEAPSAVPSSVVGTGGICAEGGDIGRSRTRKAKTEDVELAKATGKLSEAPLSTPGAKVQPAIEKKKGLPRPRNISMDVAQDVSRRLMGGMLTTQGGNRLAARRAEEKMAKEQEARVNASMLRPKIPLDQLVSAEHPNAGQGKGCGRPRGRRGAS